MAQELEKIFDLEVDLIKSSGGRFEIFLNDEQIFSKYNTYRFPEEGEIERMIREKIA